MRAECTCWAAGTRAPGEHLNNPGRGGVHLVWCIWCYLGAAAGIPSCCFSTAGALQVCVQRACAGWQAPSRSFGNRGKFGGIINNLVSRLWQRGAALEKAGGSAVRPYPRGQLGIVAWHIWQHIFGVKISPRCCRPRLSAPLFRLRLLPKLQEHRFYCLQHE